MSLFVGDPETTLQMQTAESKLAQMGQRNQAIDKKNKELTKNITQIQTENTELIKKFEDASKDAKTLEDRVTLLQEIIKQWLCS
jgi:hypothetical protein